MEDAAGIEVKENLGLLCKGINKYFVCHMKEDNQLLVGDVAGHEASYDDLLQSLRENAGAIEARPWSYGVLAFTSELRPQRKMVLIVWCPDPVKLREQAPFCHVLLVSINSMLQEMGTKIHVYIKATQPSEITEKHISATVDRVDCV